MIVLVVGMHRSGTSLVARGLHAMAANLGARIDTAPHPGNPHGHWEHADVWRAQERLLIRLGREWHSAPGPLPERWLEWPDTVATIEQFAEIAAAEVAAHGHWVVKDPRSSLLIPLWRDVARRTAIELRILRVYRSAAEVAASLAARNAMPTELAVRIWDDHQRSIDRDAMVLRTQTVRHDELLGAPLATFAALGTFCGIPDANARAAAAAAVVDPTLWHHRGGEAGDAAAEPGAVRPAAAVGSPANLGSVLVVMRTRWRLHMLPRAIRSVLSQTYPHWFLQIVNDGGPAHIVEDEVAPYRHLLAGRLGILHRDRQYGMEAASNAGIAAGPGDFIAIHDDDDSWSPEFLERMVGWLHATGQVAGVSRSQLVTDAWDGTEYVRRRAVDFGPAGDRITAADLALINQFPPISFLFRRSVFAEVGPFHEGLPALGDWEFNRRVAARHAIGVWPEALAFWHRRDSDDRAPNSPQIDHWRMEAFVKAWPDQATPPEFFSQSRQVVAWREGVAFAGFPRLAVHRPEGGVAALPAGLYLLRFPFDDPDGGAFFHRTSDSFTRHESAPLVPRPGEPLTVLVNARQPILGLGVGRGRTPAVSDIEALPSASEAVRLADPIRSLDAFAGRPRLPDVLCIGAQRSGTTWLHAALAGHPQVWACGIKEFHHFDWDGTEPVLGEFRQRQAAAVLAAAATGPLEDADREQRIRIAVRHGFAAAQSWENYARLFEAAPVGRLACDFTPAYATLGEDAVAELARVMPDITVLFILRDPVTRAVSGGLHDLRRAGIERPTEAELQEACGSAANLLRTDYLRTLDIWRRHVTGDRLHILFHDDIARDPDGVLARTCASLGIAPLPAPAGGHAVRNAGETALPAPEMARVKARLSQRWLPMLVELERRLGGPVRQWRLAAEARIRAAEVAEAGGGAGLEHTVHNNLAQWDARDPWTAAGDAWDGQARACGVPYADWKTGIVARYLPLFPRRGTILEIGPGHGRWSELLVAHAGMLVLCDIAPNCLDACRQRLAGRGRLRTHLSQAADLPADLTAAVDGVWSYDCLVHVAPEEFRRYLAEIARVLRPGGVAVLHHADRGGGGLLQRVVSRFARWRGDGAEVATGRDSPADQPGDHGWRSPVSRADVRAWARAAGLTVARQESRWTWESPHGRARIGVPRFGDCITVLRKRG